MTTVANPEKSSLSNAKSRADRCLFIRKMMDLSREAVRERYGIARGTLQNWESARFGGLTEKGAKIILKAAHAEGIECNLQWLLHGVGPNPSFTHKQDAPSRAAHHACIGSEQEMQNISDMLNLFRNHHPDAIDMVVQDDTMLPYYTPGEYVAGNRRYRQEIESVTGKVCIVQTIEHGQLLRYVKQGDELGLYHLISFNHDTQTPRPTVYNVELLSAAPIIWRHGLSPIQVS